MNDELDLPVRTTKFGEGLKKADETPYGLELLMEENVLPAKRLQPLAAEANELAAIFTTISKRSKGLG